MWSCEGKKSKGKGVPGHPVLLSQFSVIREINVMNYLFLHTAADVLWENIEFQAPDTSGCWVIAS